MSGDRAMSGWGRLILMLVTAGLVWGVTACGLTSDTSSAAGAGPSTAELTDLDPVPVTPAPTPDLPVTVRSFDGNEVTVTSADRIIAADRYGTLAQTVWALGLGANLVGRSESASFPAVADVPSVTGGNGALHVESVLALEPTVFLTDSRSAKAVLREQLAAAGVTVVYFDPDRSLTQVGPQIEAVAAALGVPEQGTILAERTRREIETASAAVPAQDPPLTMAFVYIRSAQITMLAGPGSGADELIVALGGRDAGAAAGVSAPFTAITSEAMITAAPDVLLVMTEGMDTIGGVAGVVQLPGVAQTPAGRSRRIVDMSQSVVLSFGPNTGRVVAALRDAIYDPTPA